MHTRRNLLVVLALALLPATTPAAAPLVDWDFTTGTHGWTGNPMVAKLAVTPDGLAMTSRGEDPWLEGPRFDVPENSLLRVTVEMRSSLDPVAHIFYGPTFSAERMQRFSVVNDGKNHRYTVMISGAGGKGVRLRLDPCHSPGRVLVRRIAAESILKPEAPAFDPPAPLGKFSTRKLVRSGDLVLDHHPTIWNGLRLQIPNQMLGTGYDGELIGTIINGTTEYLRLNTGEITVSQAPDGALTATCTVRDSDGGNWTVKRLFAPGTIPGTINVTSTISADRKRDAILLPWLTILAGTSERKQQGLFAGLEYLGDEPSSSKADLSVPAHKRRIPDPIKITIPLMAIAHNGACLGLTWNKSEPVAAGFDSPDRVFGSNRHAMWLSSPNIGEQRFENDLVAHTPVQLTANAPQTVHATLLASQSPSVIGAVQQYVALCPPPPVPQFPGGFDAAVDLLAHGWLDSDINDDWLFRHAVWQDRFGPQPAADAAMFQSWLATQTTNAELATRLNEGVRKTRDRLPPGDPFASTVGHVRPPVAPLVFGRIPEFVARKTNAARQQLKLFDAQGRVTYRPRDKDYAKTHFAKHANGLGGRVLADILEAAVLSADLDLATRALAILDQQAALYPNTVPRGAQTWEMPLHTPDIMAAAHMIRAYTYGFVLTGNDAYLEHARYWAWTGVPFVYLVNPTGNPYGPYATTAVLGATNWVAPIWIGLPVQWCGLVYGSSLHLLSQYDDSGPWKQFARGITIAGLQMTWPTSDAARQGLLPDFFHLRRQVSDGPAINPGTVNAHLAEAFGKAPLHAFHRFANGTILHAPGAITDIKENTNTLTFSLTGWGDQTYHIMLAGVPDKPITVGANGKPATFTHHPDQNLLVVPLRGKATIEIQFAR